MKLPYGILYKVLRSRLCIPTPGFRFLPGGRPSIVRAGAETRMPTSRAVIDSLCCANCGKSAAGGSGGETDRAGIWTTSALHPGGSMNSCSTTCTLTSAADHAASLWLELLHENKKQVQHSPPSVLQHRKLFLYNRPYLLIG